MQAFHYHRKVYVYLIILIKGQNSNTIFDQNKTAIQLRFLNPCR